MPKLQKLGRGLLLLLAVAALGAAPALADGPSAGDQQYIDPLGGGASHHKHSTTTTTAQPPPSTTTAAPPPTSTTTTTTPSTTSPSATTASTGRHKDPKRLPFTGYDAWLAAALGACLVGSGAGIRRASRRAAAD